MQIEIQMIPVSKIRKSETNPRKKRSDRGLDELSSSIKEKGVLSPILVRKISDKKTPYEVVFGESRYLATVMAGLDQVPAMVRELSDEEAFELQVIENLQREDVHPMDEAIAFDSLLKKYSVDQVSSKVGKTPGFIVKRTQLNKLIKEAREKFYEDFINVGHATLLCKLKKEDQVTAFRYLTTGYPVKMAEPVAKLQYYIRNDLMLEMKQASFNLDDPDLVPSAGACSTCPKRSGVNKTLFDDLAPDDRCGDKVCFDQKIAAHIDQQKKKIKSENPGQKITVCSQGWSYSRVNVSGEEAELSKKSDVGAVPLVITQSNDRKKLGQIVYVVLPEKQKDDKKKKSTRSSSYDQDDKQRKLNFKISQSAFHESLKALWGGKSQNLPGLNKEEKKLLVQNLVQFPNEDALAFIRLFLKNKTTSPENIEKEKQEGNWDSEDWCPVVLEALSGKDINDIIRICLLLSDEPTTWSNRLSITDYEEFNQSSLELIEADYSGYVKVVKETFAPEKPPVEKKAKKKSVKALVE